MVAAMAASLLLAACGTQTVLPAGPAGNHPEREVAERVASRTEVAVLFVGNSFSFGLPRAFKKEAEAHGRRVRTGLCATNGWTLRQHASDPETLRTIRGGHWDIVVLQEYSGIPAMNRHARDRAMFPPLRALVKEARAGGAVPVLYQTWGLRKGSPWRPGDDFHAMTARVRDGYRAASANAGKLVVVPAGDAWEREYDQGKADELFMPDGKHPARLGTAVAASAFYESLFGK